MFDKIDSSTWNDVISNTPPQRDSQETSVEVELHRKKPNECGVDECEIGWTKTFEKSRIAGIAVDRMDEMEGMMVAQKLVDYPRINVDVALRQDRMEGLSLCGYGFSTNNCSPRRNFPKAECAKSKGVNKLPQVVPVVPRKAKGCAKALLHLHKAWVQRSRVLLEFSWNEEDDLFPTTDRVSDAKLSPIAEAEDRSALYGCQDNIPSADGQNPEAKDRDALDAMGEINSQKAVVPFSTVAVPKHQSINRQDSSSSQSNHVIAVRNDNVPAINAVRLKSASKVNVATSRAEPKPKNSDEKARDVMPKNLEDKLSEKRGMVVGCKDGWIAKNVRVVKPIQFGGVELFIHSCAPDADEM
ncbi:hypothetical protein B0H11DRAFT_1907593 [Mycena galericulata]|nr:hypothetical protein B0H11DRAFT_1907593 [Mycena galericulata]